MDAAPNHSRNGSHGELLATVVHDIRNYLQGILGSIKVLLEERELGETFSDVELLKQIRRNALGAHLLVANYRDVTRLEAGLLSVTRKSVQLDNLLEHIEQLYKTEAQRRQITLFLPYELS